MYNITVKELKEKFQYYNKKYFNDGLPEVKIYIDHTRKRLGAFHHRDKSISISDYLAREEHDVMNTLVHEMVHLWQYQMFHTSNHGATFKNKAREIYEIGNGEFNITRCCNTFGVEIREEKKERTELLLFKWKGHVYGCRPAKGNGPRLKQIFAGHKEVSDIQLVSAYGDFRKLVRCSTRLHADMRIDDIPGFYRKYKVKKIA